MKAKTKETSGSRGKNQFPRTVMRGIVLLVIALVFAGSMPLGLSAQVTQVDLDNAMREFIQEAKKLSRELGPWLDDQGTDWNFWNGAHDHCNPQTHVIEISRSQLTANLEEINRTGNAAEKARKKKELLYRYAVQLLHEGSHRKALVERYGYSGNWEAEEVRCMADVCNRLIDILHELNKIICGGTPGTGDGDGIYQGLTIEQAKEMFDYIKGLIEVHRRYCEREYFRKLRKALKIDRLIAKWKSLVRARVRMLRRAGKANDYIARHIRDVLVRQIQNDSLYRLFEQIKKMFGREINIEIIFTIDPATLEPGAELKIDGKTIHRKIPAKCSGTGNRRSSWNETGGRPIYFGFAVTPGYSFMALGEFKEANTYFESMYNSCSSSTASTGGTGGTMALLLEVFARYVLPNGHELCIGSGVNVLPGPKFRQELSWPGYTESRSYDFSFLSIPLRVSYKMPVTLLNRSFFLNLTGGLEYYSASLDYNYFEEYIYTGGTGTGETNRTSMEGKLKDSALGGHISVGLEYPFKENLHITMAAGFSFASLNNFTGTVSGVNGGQEEMVLGKRGTGGTVIEPFDPSVGQGTGFSPVKAGIGGPSITIGLRYYLKKKRENIL